jgi:RecA-family ATPase
MKMDIEKVLETDFKKAEIEIHKIIKEGWPVNIQFLCDNKINFLLDEAPKTPVLIHTTNKQVFLCKGIVSELVGAGGVGKTHLLAQLALSVATGSNFLATYVVGKPGHVLLALGENTDEDIHRLLRKISSFYSEEECKEASKYLAIQSFHGIQATFMDKNGKASDLFNKFLNELQEKEPEEGWDLIILDPIARFLGYEAETNNAAATQFITLLERITQELYGKPTVLFGHHMSKAAINSAETNQTAGRGSSAITDGVRFQLTLEKVKNQEILGRFQETERSFIRQLLVTKTNFTAIPHPQYLIINKDGTFSNKEIF